MPDRKPLGIPCEVCGEPAYRRRNVTHPLNGKRMLMALCEREAAKVDRHGHPWYTHRVLSDADIVEIRERYAAGDGSLRELAKEYGVVIMTIKRAIDRGTDLRGTDPDIVDPRKRR